MKVYRPTANSELQLMKRSNAGRLGSSKSTFCTNISFWIIYRRFFTMATRSLQEVKGPGGGIDHPPPFSTEVKETAELYNFPSVPSWRVIR
jgi:hypothetical protein